MEFQAPRGRDYYSNYYHVTCGGEAFISAEKIEPFYSSTFLKIDLVPEECDRTLTIVHSRPLFFYTLNASPIEALQSKTSISSLLFSIRHSPLVTLPSRSNSGLSHRSWA